MRSTATNFIIQTSTWTRYSSLSIPGRNIILQSIKYIRYTLELNQKPQGERAKEVENLGIARGRVWGGLAKPQPGPPKKYIRSEPGRNWGRFYIEKTEPASLLVCLGGPNPLTCRDSSWPIVIIWYYKVFERVTNLYSWQGGSNGFILHKPKPTPVRKKPTPSGSCLNPIGSDHFAIHRNNKTITNSLMQIFTNQSSVWTFRPRNIIIITGSSFMVTWRRPFKPLPITVINITSPCRSARWTSWQIIIPRSTRRIFIPVWRWRASFCRNPRTILLSCSGPWRRFLTPDIIPLIATLRVRSNYKQSIK